MMNGKGTNHRTADPALGLSEGSPPTIDSVLTHRDRVISILAARTGGRWDVAEDLWANIVMILVEQPKKLADVSRLQPWLYRLACNKAADWIRQQQRTAEHHLASGGELLANDLLPSSEHPPLAVLMQLERHNELMRTIGLLPPEDQEVLYLKYAHGWSYDQICEQMGLTHYQVTNRLRVARQRLKLELLKSPLAAECSAGKPTGK